MVDEIKVPNIGGKWKAKIAGMTPAGWMVVFLSVVVIGLVFAVVEQARQSRYWEEAAETECMGCLLTRCYQENPETWRDEYMQYVSTGSWP